MRAQFRRSIILLVVLSFLVNFYNITRFPLFNNSFDPWFHYTIALREVNQGLIDLSSYYGFPGIHVIMIYLSGLFNTDLSTIIRFLPLFSGVLSTFSMIYFLNYIVGLPSFQERGVSVVSREKIVLLGVLFNTTISLYSLVSSGIFWGQMFTASLLPPLFVKFIEVNKKPSKHNMLEYFLIVMALFFIHHLTSLLLITFLSFTQLYLVTNRKASIKGFLLSIICLIVFLIRVEVLDLQISIISDLTWGKTKYFYMYFLVLFLSFAVFYLFKKVKRKWRNSVESLVSRYKIAVLVLFGLGLAFIFLRYIMPYLMTQFGGLSNSWFIFYGSNLLLLGPFAVVGVLSFGKVLSNSTLRIVVYLWVSTIIFVLVMYFAMFLFNIPVDSLGFGRLSTFLYPFLSLFSGFSIVSPVLSSRSGRRRQKKFRRNMKRVGPAMKVAVLCTFSFLFPLSVIGFNPPPDYTLTRYWNVHSEQATVEFIADGVVDGSIVACDYHEQEMIKFYRFDRNSNFMVLSSQLYFRLDQPGVLSSLDSSKQYLILVDEVILEYSLSYFDSAAGHETQEPLGWDFLSTYDGMEELNKIYSTSSEWLYQV
ncbi:MAG: hypothetical protein ACTSUE_02980 [Promethearchaeota archaeon]